MLTTGYKDVSSSGAGSIAYAYPLVHYSDFDILSDGAERFTVIGVSLSIAVVQMWFILVVVYDGCCKFLW